MLEHERAAQLGDPVSDASLPKQIGRFQVERLLGRGGMGLVFLAYDPVLQRRVALKVPRVDLTSDPEMRDRFFLEARLASKLEHPGLVPVYEAGVDQVTCYIASAWCKGPDLEAWLEQRKAEEKPVAPKEAAHWVRLLAETVGYCHGEGVLHRDLKPSNVLLEPQEAPEKTSFPFMPKITDFGLAGLVQESLDQTKSSLLLGTPQYMAPEQAECRADSIGEATDVYALGVILYEMLVGHPPHQGVTTMEVLDKIRHQAPPPLRSLRSDVSRDLETIVKKCLEKRPEDRYASAQALAEDLRCYEQEKPIAARSLSIVRQIDRWSLDRRKVREVGRIAIGVQVLIILWMLYVQGEVVLGIPMTLHKDPMVYVLTAFGIALLLNMVIAVAGFRTQNNSLKAILWGKNGTIGLVSCLAFTAYAVIFLLHILR